MSTSPLIFVRDGRTLPFVPVTLVALRTIREKCEHRAYAIATYMALLELASDARTDRVATAQKTICDHVGVSRTTVQTALAELKAAGVLEVVEQHHANSRLENVYVVVEPGQKDSAPDAPPLATRATPTREVSEGRSSDEQRSYERKVEETPTPLPLASEGNRKRRRGAHPLDGIRSIAPGSRWTTFVNRLEQLAGPAAYELYLDDLVLVGLDPQDRVVVAGRCCWNPAHVASVVARAAQAADFEVRLATVAEAESVSGHRP
jgi:biotin operon repressor